MAVLAVLLMVTGTFAWTSFSQRALNENEGTPLPPGGRIHDDYNKATGNKDIYAENYGNQSVYVRIKLSEYLELDGKPLITGAKKEDRSTWAPYTGSNSGKSTTAAFLPYVGKITGKFGDSKVFLPTFNTDNTNLQTDAAGDAIDYITNGPTALGDGSETYFTNGQKVENPEDPTQVNVAKKTIALDQGLIYLNTWKSYPANKQVGNYWVLDTTDGWAYWANKLAPSEATGPFLNGLSFKGDTLNAVEDSWYYGMDVIGEFATESDKGNFNQSEYGAPSADAQRVINRIEEPTISEIPLGESFELYGREYFNMKDMGDGNHLLVATKEINVPYPVEARTNDYNNHPLNAAMKEYYTELPENLQAMVQPVQKMFVPDCGSTSTFGVDSTGFLLNPELMKDYTKVTPDGEKKAFALSAADINDMCGEDKAIKVMRDRMMKIGYISFLRTQISSGNNQLWCIRMDGSYTSMITYGSDTTRARPAIIVHQ